MAPRDKVQVSAAKQRDANPVDSTRPDAVCSAPLPMFSLLHSCFPNEYRGVVAVSFLFTLT